MLKRAPVLPTGGALPLLANPIWGARYDAAAPKRAEILGDGAMAELGVHPKLPQLLDARLKKVYPVRT